LYIVSAVVAVSQTTTGNGTIVKAPLATARAHLRIDAVHLFVCKSVAKMRI